MVDQDLTEDYPGQRIDGPDDTPSRYEVRLVLAVGPASDEHLQTAGALRAELQSWVESLNATAERIEVTGGSTSCPPNS